ncbi:MAG: hypothetical protein IAF38_02085 [Bacteroidia bacterium]|nr:hypothetical protein [Bacteroidia bacterium]
MKALSNIRYILFAVSLLGLFANFAQNEYGLDMLFYSDVFIAFIFFIEAFVYCSRAWKSGKIKALFILSNHFLVGCIFLGLFFRHMHWGGAGLLMVFSTLFLLIQYLVYSARIFVKESKKGMALSFILFLFVMATICSLLGVVFKNMHWPGASLLLILSGILCLFFLPFIFTKIKYKYNGELITLKARLAKLSGKTVMIFCYFGFWGIYSLCVSYGIVPGFYNLSRPPAAVKLDDARANDRSETYWVNYESFLEGRREAEENEGNLKAGDDDSKEKVSVEF